jgi:hypothetical protein
MAKIKLVEVGPRDGLQNEKKFLSVEIRTEFVKKLVEAGHKLILFTMRSDLSKVNSNDKEIHAVPGQYLTAALSWFKRNDIPLYGVQTNPTQSKWTSSNKCYAHLYIDDAGLGIPLLTNKLLSDRPFVNWVKVEELLIDMHLITPDCTIPSTNL